MVGTGDVTNGGNIIRSVSMYCPPYILYNDDATDNSIMCQYSIQRQCARPKMMEKSYYVVDIYRLSVMLADSSEDCLYATCAKWPRSKYLRIFFFQHRVNIQY